MAVARDRKLKQILEIVESKKAEDVRILDLRKLTWITDYFVILHGDSLIQNRAIAEALMDNLRERPISVEGYEDGRWILMDYGDVIVHIFMPETRRFYHLEKLWGDAEVVSPA
mgnify:CR=1 FL=1